MRGLTGGAFRGEELAKANKLFCCREASCPFAKWQCFPLSPLSRIRSATWRTTNPPQERRHGQDGGALARATSIGPRAATEPLQMRLVAILAAASRGTEAIMIVYRLYGVR